MRVGQDERGEFMLLTLEGRLDQRSAPGLHRRLLVALATHARPLVCDVGALHIADVPSLTLFQGVGVQAMYWPGTPVVLCGADPPTVEVLRRLRVDRVVSVRDTVAAALTRCRPQPPVHGDVLRLPPLPPAARAARELVRSGCRGYSAETVETAVLLVNELVTHALKGARRELSVRLSLRGPAIRIAVADDDPRQPHHIAAPADPDENLDLRLLNGLTDRWGALPTADGKVVWCLLED